MLLVISLLTKAALLHCRDGSDMSATQQLTKTTPEQIQHLCDEIVRGFHPERVILFGSYAYGNPSPESDVDLLVVMPFQGSSREQAVRIRSSIDTPIAFDLIVRTPQQISERLAMGDFFFEEITEQGKAIYEAHHA
jgi:predicted nucleotidyltransferase